MYRHQCILYHQCIIKCIEVRHDGIVIVYIVNYSVSDNVRIIESVVLFTAVTGKCIK
jgi:hypothetical protein